MLKKQNISVDLRIVSLVLLTVIGAMLIIWKPWTVNTVSQRTITISGDATQKAEPDEYQFSPSYIEKGSDRSTIQKSLADKINQIVVKLKEIGVADSDITLASSTYDNYYNDGSNEVTSNSLTITVGNRELSQKIQDYLLTTSPQGQVTPYPTFSTSKRKSLESDVRVKAIDDAKKKATQTASELGAKLGKVVSVTDQGSGMMPMPYGGAAINAMSLEDKVGGSSLPILPGKQDLSVTVEVVYEIK